MKWSIRKSMTYCWTEKHLNNCSGLFFQLHQVTRSFCEVYNTVADTHRGERWISHVEAFSPSHTDIALYHHKDDPSLRRLCLLMLHRCVISNSKRQKKKKKAWPVTQQTFLNVRCAALCKQCNNMAITIIYRACLAADDLGLCSEGK